VSERFFNQSVSYTYLKPVIAAYGLRENKFSWTIRGEALRAGSHKFVAVVGVPKHSEGVGLAMSAHVRLKKNWLGEWYDGEGIAGTDARETYVSFQ
jgi:hypothetical protein